MTTELEAPTPTMTGVVVVPRTVRVARWAVTGVFAINGLLVGTYLARIPSLQTDLGLTGPQLGAILTCWGVAALLTMALVGGWVARFGSARVIRLTLAALPFSLYGIGSAATPWLLAVAVAVGGALVGTLDAAMNAHAVAVERRLDRPIMSSCHAAASGSAIVASLLCAAAIRADVSMATHTLYVGSLMLLAGLAISTGLLPAAADQAAAHRPAASRDWRAGWTGPVLVLGVLGMAIMLCEAAVISWSGVFLHTDRGATLAQAALGYGAFTLFQTIGRLTGDPLTRRLGRLPVFRAHAAIAVVGFVIVLTGRAAPVSLIGFAVVGYGTSVLVPLVFSAVGHAGGDGPRAAIFVSRATAFIYAGILIGPALAGWLGQVIGLTATFGCLIPLLVATAIAARVMGPTHGLPSGHFATSNRG
jgi:predicted MFS family arabinose efflux permease